MLEKCSVRCISRICNFVSTWNDNTLKLIKQPPRSLFIPHLVSVIENADFSKQSKRGHQEFFALYKDITNLSLLKSNTRTATRMTLFYIITSRKGLNSTDYQFFSVTILCHDHPSPFLVTVIRVALELLTKLNFNLHVAQIRTYS